MTAAFLTFVMISPAIEWDRESPRYPGVRISDAVRFGVPVEVVRGNYHLAVSTLNAARKEFGPRLDPVWEEWQKQRVAAWAALWSATDPGSPPETRRYWLSNLKYTLHVFWIGTDVDPYSLGFIPGPIPE